MTDQSNVPGDRARWTVGCDGSNVSTIYEGEAGIAQVFGLPMNTRVDDPCLKAPQWAAPLVRARLMAGAPELLNAAIWLLACRDEMLRAWNTGQGMDKARAKIEGAEKRLRASIAKAEGR